jgi:hypothetical protein
MLRRPREGDRRLCPRVRRLSLAAAPQGPRAGRQARDPRVLPVQEPQRPLVAGLLERGDAIQVLARLREAAHADKRPADRALGDDQHAGIAAFGELAELATEGERSLMTSTHERVDP